MSSTCSDSDPAPTVCSCGLVASYGSQPIYHMCETEADIMKPTPGVVRDAVFENGQIPLGTEILFHQAGSLELTRGTVVDYSGTYYQVKYAHTHTYVAHSEIVACLPPKGAEALERWLNDD